MFVNKLFLYNEGRMRGCVDAINIYVQVLLILCKYCAVLPATVLGAGTVAGHAKTSKLGQNVRRIFDRYS